MNVDALIKTGRRLAADALLDEGVISDPVEVSDGRGGWTTTFVERPVAIPCRVVGVKDQLAENIADVLQGPNTGVILCKYGVDIPEGSRIRINDTLYQIGAKLSADSVTVVLERYVGREV